MITVFNIAFVLLSILGLVTLIKELILWIMRCDEGDIISIIPIEGHCENAEYRIRCAYERANWSAANFRLICLDKGMDDETRKICERVCEIYGIEILSDAALKGQVNALKTDKVH